MATFAGRVLRRRSCAQAVRLQGAGEAHAAGVGHAGVAGGGLQVLVAEELLDGAQVDAGLEQVGGEGVAQAVGREVPVEAALHAGLLEDVLDGADAPAAPVCGDKEGCVTVSVAHELSEDGAEAGAGNGQAVAPALAAADADDQLLEVDVTDVEGNELADPDAARVGEEEGEPVAGVANGAGQRDDLLAGGDVGELLLSPGSGDDEFSAVASVELDVEEAQSGDVLVDQRP